MDLRTHQKWFFCLTFRWDLCPLSAFLIQIGWSQWPDTNLIYLFPKYLCAADCSFSWNDRKGKGSLYWAFMMCRYHARSRVTWHLISWRPHDNPIKWTLLKITPRCWEVMPLGQSHTAGTSGGDRDSFSGLVWFQEFIRRFGMPTIYVQLSSMPTQSCALYKNFQSFGNAAKRGSTENSMRASPGFSWLTNGDKHVVRHR